MLRAIRAWLERRDVARIEAQLLIDYPDHRGYCWGPQVGPGQARRRGRFIGHYRRDAPPRRRRSDRNEPEPEPETDDDAEVWL